MLSRLRLAAALICAATPAFASSPVLDPHAVESAGFARLPVRPASRPMPEVVKAEVMLDRATFSPGEIDGFPGDNLRGALMAYQRQAGLDANGRLDSATWDKLMSGAPSPIATYRITGEDAKGPFVRRIPLNFEAQSRLKHLGYHDLVEELAERFHMSPALLKALNPKARFKPGETIAVAHIEHLVPSEKAARVVVDKADRNVEALAADGRLLAYYPASIGSADKPAPSGDFTIRRVDRDPIYTYDPKYHFKGVSAKEPFSIAPGPNNPVGLVWMDLGGEGYGIHGTPEPDAVGKTQSHGCIRLTNWDALSLAERVAPGTPVSFGDVPGSTGPGPATPPVAATTPEGTATPQPSALTPAAAKP